MSNSLLVQEPETGVLLLTLNRPEVLNALNTAVLEQLGQALEEAAANPAIKVAVITGSNKAFAAGADINEMAARDMVGILQDPRVEQWQRISRFPKPLLAAVNGFALGGGCELALHADLVIAGENARFGQPEINLGIMPGAGGTQRLTRALGTALAMRMVLTGEAITAQQAQQAGWVSQVCPPELTLEKTLQLAQVIAAKPPLAVQLIKEAIHKAADTDLATGLRFERHAFTLLAGTADRAEGLAAFQAKRPPKFTGN